MTAKSNSKQEAVPYNLPFGKARYPRISSPDTNGKYADNKFKTDILYEDDVIDGIESDLRDIAEKFWPDVSRDELYVPVKEFFIGKDDKRESQGRGVTLKSKYRPAVFDAKRNKLPKGLKIGSGSIIRVAAFAFPWSKATEEVHVDAKGKKTKVKTTTYGIGLRLGDTQIKKLVEPTGGGDGSAFDDVEDDDENFVYDGKSNAFDDVSDDEDNAGTGDATDF